MYYGLKDSDKYKIKYHKKFLFSASKNYKNIQAIYNIIEGSGNNFIYSHFGDTDVFGLKNGFEWVRPAFYTSNKSKAAEYNNLYITLSNDKGVIDFLNKKTDSVIFTPFIDECFANIKIKNILDHDEYSCNLRNCRSFFSGPYTDFLADCFFNGKFANIVPNYDDIESIINLLCSEYAGTGSLFKNNKENKKEVIVTLNNSIKFLNQHLNEYLKGKDESK